MKIVLCPNKSVTKDLLLHHFRLSERNVIEIVRKLSELGLIEVIYTVDGKEYLTPQELNKEIKEELSVHGGMG